MSFGFYFLLSYQDLGDWFRVASEWLEIPPIEPSQPKGHPSLIEQIEEAKKKMRQIGDDAKCTKN